MKKISPTYYFYALASLLPFFIYYVPFFGPDFSFPEATLKGLSKAPWIALPLIGFLGLRLNQTRILFSAGLLLASYHLLQSPQESAVLALSGRNLELSLSFSLPLGLIAVFSFKESPLWSQISLARLLTALFPYFLMSGLLSQDPQDFQKLMGWEAFPDGSLLLPHAALLAWCLFLAQSLAFGDAKLRGFWPALALGLLPVFLAVQAAVERPISHTSFVVLSYIAVSAMLSWAIFQMYWQRVYMDELTAVPNRRALDEKMHALTGTYALAMVDIDHFKKFNDSYGHDEGDNVLRLVAAHLSLGSNGRAFRYGGEEFCMVFEGWSTQQAAELADEIRDGLAKREFSLRLPHNIRDKTSVKDRGSLKDRSVKVKVTISIGVAAPDKKHPGPEDVIKLADEGLYKAKDAGRNKVIRQN